MRKLLCAAAGVLALAACGGSNEQSVATAQSEARADRMIGVNVVLKGDITPAIVADLGKYGRVRDQIPELDALTMQVSESTLAKIQALPYVASAGPDAERDGAPIDRVAASDFSGGRSTWDLDAINVTDFGGGRTIGYDGTGVYVAVLDTGLVDAWRSYFPEQRIATSLARAFAGGGGDVGNVSSQPEKWQHDQNSHGTHVTSTIIGWQYPGSTVAINGVAPMATIIPVKVLNQNGHGWSSVIARGITYVTDLKVSGALGSSPVVINMSLGGGRLDPLEQAAIDYATKNGVVIVASAGNTGPDGHMGYPGAYEPVISVAASGWAGEWAASSWWLRDVPEGDASAFYIADFSSREGAGQFLDVAAPGSWVLGPYEVNSGNSLSAYYLGGTSMASPHVAGVVALMKQKNPGLDQGTAHQILKDTALQFTTTSCLVAPGPNLASAEVKWGADATGAGLVQADAALAATP